MQINLIAALSRTSRTIGYGGQLPWTLPNDLKHFHHTTQGNAILMGYRTWQSLPKRPLQGRINYVLSKRTHYLEGAMVVDALKAVPIHPVLWVIGGQMTYELCLPYAHTMLLTWVDYPHIGDTFFPACCEAEWHQTVQWQQPIDAQHAYAFTVEKWDRCTTCN
jgi:dihydrofolate reductase